MHKYNGIHIATYRITSLWENRFVYNKLMCLITKVKVFQCSDSPGNFILKTTVIIIIITWLWTFVYNLDDSAPAVIGLKGDQGFPGFPGANGDPGISGVPGLDGISGTKGRRGDSGLYGPEGK